MKLLSELCPMLAGTKLTVFGLTFDDANWTVLEHEGRSNTIHCEPAKDPGGRRILVVPTSNGTLVETRVGQTIGSIWLVSPSGQYERVDLAEPSRKATRHLVSKRG